MRATLQLLKADSRSLPEIFRDTGIPFYWLRTFQAGSMKNPSVNRVQHLYECLTGTSLKVYFVADMAKQQEAA